MRRFFFNVTFADDEGVTKSADSNSKATAINMLLNQFPLDRQEKITAIEVYAEKELKV